MGHRQVVAYRAADHQAGSAAELDGVLDGVDGAAAHEQAVFDHGRRFLFGQTA